MTIGFGSWIIETIKWIINLGKNFLDYLKNKFWMLKKMKEEDSMKFSMLLWGMLSKIFLMMLFMTFFIKLSSENLDLEKHF